MTELRRPDLHKLHPQNVDVENWSDGWLVLACANGNPEYVIMHEHERKARGWPSSREERILAVQKQEGRK